MWMWGKSFPKNSGTWEEGILQREKWKATQNDAAIGEDYPAHFDPEKYLQSMYAPSCFDPNQSPFHESLRFMARSLDEVFGGGEIHGKRLLDVGSGPSIYTVISAAPWFDEITLSDYTEQNRAALKQWVDNDSAKFDFSGCFEHISKLQSRKNSRPADLESLVRSKIADIVLCDVTSPTIIQPQSEFDCIVTSLCLESGCPDIATYKDALRKIASMLTSGGHFVQVGSLTATFYSYGDSAEYFALPLTKKVACDSLAEAGFVDLTWRESPINVDSYDCTGVFVLKAKKGT